MLEKLMAYGYSVIYRRDSIKHTLFYLCFDFTSTIMKALHSLLNPLGNKEFFVAVSITCKLSQEGR